MIAYTTSALIRTIGSCKAKSAFHKSELAAQTGYLGIGPLQVAIHVTQNRRADEQKSHRDKLNKRHT